MTMPTKLIISPVTEAAVTPGFALLTSQVCHNLVSTALHKILTINSGTPRKSKVLAQVSGSHSTALHKSSAVW
jgi:hypothetical protein